MGYFKSRRLKRDEAVTDKVLDYVNKQARLTEAAIGVALRKVDMKRLDYEGNMRENIEQMFNDGGIGKLVEEVAAVIDEQSKVYGYRIAKSKRTELAQDILEALSIKK